MVRQSSGRPAIVIRLPQEVIDLLMARAAEKWGPVQKARAGGASRLVREWIYQGLGLEPPVEWGEKNPRHASYQRARRARLAAEQAAKEEEAVTEQPDNQDQEGNPL